MTRAELTENARIQILGVILDGMISQRRGGELAIWVSAANSRILSELTKTLDQAKAIIMEEMTKAGWTPPAKKT